MQKAFEQFNRNCDRVHAIHQTYLAITKNTAPILDLSDLLRSEIVLIVSALDHFIHEIARLGMIEIWKGDRRETPAFQRFHVPLSATKHLLQHRGDISALETEIRKTHGWKSFQTHEKIAEAIRLVSEIDLWSEVSTAINMNRDDVTRTLNLLVERRNKIAHEADMDPTYPGQRWTIDPLIVERALLFTSRVAEAIYETVRLRPPAP